MSPAIRPIEDRRLLGIGLALAGYSCFTIIDTCAKWLSLGGLPTMEIVFVRYAAQFLIVSALFFPQRGMALTTTRNLPVEIVRGLALMASTDLQFHRAHLPAADGHLGDHVHVAADPLRPLDPAARRNRRLAALARHPRRLSSACSSSYVPARTRSTPPRSCRSWRAACGALYMLLTRKLAGVDATTTQQFYSGLVATVCVAPFALGGWVWPSEPSGWFAFGLIGAAALIGHQFITTAHRFAPASVLAPFSYFQIIFMTASSWLIFNQPPEVWLYVGAPDRHRLRALSMGARAPIGEGRQRDAGRPLAASKLIGGPVASFRAPT